MACRRDESDGEYLMRLDLHFVLSFGRIKYSPSGINSMRDKAQDFLNSGQGDEITKTTIDMMASVETGISRGTRDIGDAMPISCGLAINVVGGKSDRDWTTDMRGGMN